MQAKQHVGISGIYHAPGQLTRRGKGQTVLRDEGHNEEIMLGLIWSHLWGLSETSPGAANLGNSSFQPNLASSYYPGPLMASAGMSPPRKGLFLCL